MASGTITLGEGAAGPQGATGATGQGVPTGGTTGQILTKLSATNYDTTWATSPLAIPPTNFRYVNAGGDDLTGNGSLEKPFRTVGACEDSILDAGQFNQYLILLGPGFYVESPPFEFQAFINIEASGIAFIFRDDFSPAVFTPSGDQASLVLKNVTLFGLNAISDPAATTPQLTLIDVSVPFGGLICTGGEASIDGLMLLYFQDCNFGDSSYFNATAQGATSCTFAGIQTSDVAAAGHTGAVGSGISLTACSHTSLTALQNSSITRVNCSRRAGSFTLDGSGAAIAYGEVGMGGLNDSTVYTFDGTDTIVYVSGQTPQVGNGVISHLLPADTIVIADLGAGSFQVSASATGSGTFASITISATFLNGALPSRLTGTPAVVQNSVYIPATSSDWPIVPQLCGQALDLLASSRVLAPTSSTDNALCRFDGATGKLVQNSNAILADSGLLTVGGGVHSLIVPPISPSLVVNVDGNEAGAWVSAGGVETVEGAMIAYAGSPPYAFYIGSLSNHPCVYFANNESFFYINPDGQHVLFADGGSNPITPTGAILSIADVGGSNATHFLKGIAADGTTVLSSIDISGNVDAIGYKVAGTPGIDHTETINGKLFTWSKGILTSVV